LILHFSPMPQVSQIIPCVQTKFLIRSLLTSGCSSPGIPARHVLSIMRNREYAWSRRKQARESSPKPLNLAQILTAATPLRRMEAVTI
jgi:hypothetical protein